MKNPLWKKYISESWLLLLAIGIGLFAFGWFRVTVVCELDTGKFRQIIDLLPSDSVSYTHLTLPTNREV